MLSSVNKDVIIIIIVNCLGGLNLPRKSGVRLTDRLDVTIVVDWDSNIQTNNKDSGRSTTDPTSHEPDVEICITWFWILNMFV